MQFNMPSDEMKSNLNSKFAVPLKRLSSFFYINNNKNP